MRMTGLNFDSIPRLDVPLRFYLTAPLFALFAGLFLVDLGSDLWLTRWFPSSLAITHLVALGVMAMIMIGSLFQVMPVLCGAPIKIDGVPLFLMHIGLIFGTIALSASFMGWLPLYYSFVLLGLSLGYFVFSLLRVLITDSSGEQTRNPILFAVSFFGLVLIAGLLLSYGYLSGVDLSIGKLLTHFHASLAVFGWILLLIMAVSFQVIPMFHVTPTFSPFWRRTLIYGIVITLLVMVVITATEGELYLAGVVNALLGIIYAVVGTLQLNKRKRKLPDVTVSYWLCSYISLTAGCALLIALPFLPETWIAKLEVLCALVIAFGFILGVIQGMLLKIVPFLTTLHLQSVAMKVAMENPAAMMMLPDHYSLISRQQGKWQFRLYLMVMFSVLLSFFWPQLSLTIGIAFILNWLYVGYNVVSAFTQFYRVKNRMTSG